MDLSLLKKRMETLSNKGQKGKKLEKIDYAAILWKPKVGKHQIRIVPSAYDKTNPFKEVFLHYGYAKFPIFALSNWGEADPIVDFAKSLRATGDKDDWKLAGKLEPKLRVFIPVVVRGEEEKGTRLWEVGVKIYKQLLAIADDEDYGDFTDITAGRDFTVTAVKEDVAGRESTVCSIQIKPKQTAVTTDPALLEKLLNNQPDILEVNARYKQTYDGLKEVLMKFLNPDSEVDETANTTSTVGSASDEDEEEPEDLNSGGSEVPAALATTVKAKVKNADKFDQLFDNE